VGCTLAHPLLLSAERPGPSPPPLLPSFPRVGRPSQRTHSLWPSAPLSRSARDAALLSPADRPAPPVIPFHLPSFLPSSVFPGAQQTPRSPVSCAPRARAPGRRSRLTKPPPAPRVPPSRRHTPARLTLAANRAAAAGAAGRRRAVVSPLSDVARAPWAYPGVVRILPRLSFPSVPLLRGRARSPAFPSRSPPSPRRYGRFGCPLSPQIVSPCFPLSPRAVHTPNRGRERSDACSPASLRRAQRLSPAGAGRRSVRRPIQP
jgi:hypothetical protein